MSNHDEEQVYRELTEFLVSPRNDVRVAATEAVLQVVSTGNDGIAKLIQQDGIVSNLAKNVNHPSNAIAINALKSLLLLSSGPSSELSHQCIQDLLDVQGLNRMMEIILSSSGVSSTTNTPSGDENENENGNGTDETKLQAWRDRVNYAMALLANMTRVEAAAVELVGRTLPDEPIYANATSKEGQSSLTLPPRPTMELLLARFLNDAYVVVPSSSSEEHQHQHEQQPHQHAIPRHFDNIDDNMNGEDDNYFHTIHRYDMEHKTCRLDMYSNDPFQHFAAVLMNITQLESGRKFVMKLDYSQTKKQNADTSDSEQPSASTYSSSVLQKLLSQLKSLNPIRRRGIAGMIRNCCLENDFVWWLLNVVEIHKHIMYPLAGPEELDMEEKQGLDPDLWMEGPDKRREIDPMTRLLLVESILLLCTTGRKSRERLRLDRTDIILKWCDMAELDENVSEQIQECMTWLRRDVNIEDGGSSEQQLIPDDVYPELHLTQATPVGSSSASGTALPVFSTTTTTNSNKDFDDVD